MKVQFLLLYSTLNKHIVSNTLLTCNQRLVDEIGEIRTNYDNIGWYLDENFDDKLSAQKLTLFNFVNFQLNFSTSHIRETFWEGCSLLLLVDPFRKNTFLRFPEMEYIGLA